MRVLKISVTHIVNFLLFELPVSDQVLTWFHFLICLSVLSSKNCMCSYRFAGIYYCSGMCQEWPESSSCWFVSYSNNFPFQELNWLEAYLCLCQCALQDLCFVFIWHLVIVRFCLYLIFGVLIPSTEQAIFAS